MWTTLGESTGNCDGGLSCRRCCSQSLLRMKLCPQVERDKRSYEGKAKNRWRGTGIVNRIMRALTVAISTILLFAFEVRSDAIVVERVPTERWTWTSVTIRREVVALFAPKPRILLALRRVPNPRWLSNALGPKPVQSVLNEVFLPVFRPFSVAKRCTVGRSNHWAFRAVDMGTILNWHR